MLSILLTSVNDLIADPSLDANYWPRFLMQLFFILCICKFLAFVLSYLHMPPVIGEILGGIIVGPSVLGYSTFWATKVFPTSSWNYFTLVANLGLILFMFFLGLELDHKMVRKMYKTSFPIAVSAIVVPFGLGSLASLYYYDINGRDILNNVNLTAPQRAEIIANGNIDQVAFILFFGASMSFTALPVLASLLSATGLIATPVGVVGISCATVDDILAWCVLAVATAFAHGNRLNGLYTFLIAIAYVLAMFFVVRPVVERVHRFFLDRKDEMNSYFVFFMMIVLIVSSFTAEVIGIHSFFGGFAAGLIAPRAGKWHIEMAPKIETIVVEVMLPLFFANSGMRTSIGSIDSGFYVGVTILIIVIATLGKFLPSCLSTRYFTKRDWRFCITIGVLMNTRGLVELIALNIGYSLGILSPRLFTMLVIMALVTTAMTPPSVYYLYQRRYFAELEKNKRERIQEMSEIDGDDVDRKAGDEPVVFSEYDAQYHLANHTPGTGVQMVPLESFRSSLVSSSATTLSPVNGVHHKSHSAEGFSGNHGEGSDMHSGTAIEEETVQIRVIDGNSSPDEA